ncbi:MAG TPA: hypothetical protein VD788_06425, partial [Candidatus Polarisedimenticolaceae bacterium]|nr:hypothetical protein [Candidatus Polarisedimenticolaceae bacterium]
KVAWNGLTPLTAEAFNDPDRVRGHLEQIEPALANLEKVLAITDYQRAADLRAKIDQYVSQMDAQRTTLVQQATADTMTYCKQQWNSFRWWSDRRFEMLSKTPSRADFDEYRVGCRQYIESERIGDKVAELEDEIDQALVLRGCQRTWEQLRQQPDPAALREFETSCQEYVKLYEVTEQLQQVKNRIGG